jgi:uncharacterized RDD family membrane protein YckC
MQTLYLTKQAAPYNRRANIMEKPIPITVDMLATPNKRFANFFIDSLLCYLLVLGATFGGNLLYDKYGFEGLAVGKPDIQNLRFSLLHTAITIIYYGLFESLTQRTPAKFITNTKVVLRDGTRPDNITILLRSLCRQIPFEALSFLGRYGIGWHDSFTKTLVVDVVRYDTAVHQKKVKDSRKEAL